MATKDTTVSASDLCEWLGIGLDALVKLAPRSRVIRASHGRYWLRQSVRAYCDFKNKTGNGDKHTDAKRIHNDDPRTRLAEAKARIAEAEAARLEGEQIRVDIAVALFADMVANARTKLLTLESRVPIEARNITRDIVHDALNELSQYNQSELISRLCGQSTIDVDAAAEPESQ